MIYVLWAYMRAIATPVLVVLVCTALAVTKSTNVGDLRSVLTLRVQRIQ